MFSSPLRIPAVVSFEEDREEDLQERCSTRDEEIVSLHNNLLPAASRPVEGKCVDMVNVLSDATLCSGKHKKATVCYPSALSLNPAHTVDILVERSKARASEGLWEDALTDAIEVRILCCLWLH